MKNLFIMGGPLFMGILTLLLIMMVTWVVYHFVASLNEKKVCNVDTLRKVGYTKSIGLFAMIIGILGQLIGLYEAFSVIEYAGDISPTMVFAGIKVSMITTLYGMLIYLLSLLLWFLVSNFVEKKLVQH